jgi:secreted trypsin-like serine protease
MFETPTQRLTVVHGTNDLTAGGARRGVSQVILHPLYTNENSWQVGNDLALIKLDRPLDVTPAQVVRLQSKRLEQQFGQPGDCAVVTGWGYTKWAIKDIQTRLRQVDLPIIDPASCKRTWNGFGDGQVCAGYRQGSKTSCNGDSGGPLVVPGGPSGWSQLGIVSYGPTGCERPNAYAVFTRVSSFIDWIVRTTRGGSKLDDDNE